MKCDRCESENNLIIKEDFTLCENCMYEYKKLIKNFLRPVKKHLMILPFKLPSLNDYMRVAKGNKYAGNSLKRQCQNDIALFTSDLPKIENKVKINFTWVEENKRRDIDNVAFAKKFILDALVENGVLIDDSPKYIIGFSDDFKYEKRAKILVEIEEQI